MNFLKGAALATAAIGFLLLKRPTELVTKTYRGSRQRKVHSPKLGQVRYSGTGQ